MSPVNKPDAQVLLSPDGWEGIKKLFESELIVQVLNTTVNNFPLFSLTNNKVRNKSFRFKDLLRTKTQYVPW
jgi:hypothetical protein